MGATDSQKIPGGKLCVADPTLLALPPLADGEVVRATGQRAVKPIPAALPAMGPVGFNLFGVHDIYGRGTHVDPSPHCDPFLMCAAMKAPPGMKPPFCAHPHCGASVASIMFNGGAIMPWDNVQGTEPEPLLPGGIYHVNTGAGCVHDEPFEAIDLRTRTRPGFADGEPTSQPVGADGDQRTWMMQLWWNAIDMSQPVGTPLTPVCSQVVSPAEVPRIVQPDGLLVRVVGGSYQGSQDVLAASSAHATLLLHVRVEPGVDGTLGPLPSDFNGFAWVLEGKVTVGGGGGGGGEEAGEEAGNGVEVEHGANGLVLLPPGGDSLRLRHSGGADSSGAAQVFIGFGRPHRKPYCKYVGYGGGLIHRSVEEAMEAMGEYEADPKGYGRNAAAGAAKEVDTSAFELVAGFQSNGGDMMERRQGIMARFKYKE